MSSALAVESALVESVGWRFDRKDGFARSEVRLEPNAVATARFVYEIRASNKVVLPF
jgi:hypothetical protein